MLSFIVFSWFFNLSFMPNECYAVNNSFCQEKNAIVTEIGLDATLWNRLTIAGSMESFEFPIGFDFAFSSLLIVNTPYTIIRRFSQNRSRFIYYINIINISEEINEKTY